VSSIAEVFAKDPLTYTPEDRQCIIDHYKANRHLFGETKPVKAWEIDEIVEAAMKEVAPPPPKRKKARKRKPKTDPRQIDLEELLHDKTRNSPPADVGGVSPEMRALYDPSRRRRPIDLPEVEYEYNPIAVYDAEIPSFNRDKG